MKNWTSMLIALVLTAALCFGAAAGMAEGVLTLPSAVKEIQAEAFAGAKGFAEIILPEGVEKIGERAFAESSIEQILIPDGVTDIGTGAFYNCVDLVSADVSDGVTEIADYLFWRCLKLEQVDIPAGVTRIGEHAFSACIALPEIEIPDGVTEIGEYAFSECAALTQVTVPGSVKSIGQMAFYSCLDLETVVLKDGVESIDNNAFFYCPYLTRVEIPASVTSIGMSAFGDCDELMIYGETGSYAQTYAMEHGIPFISEAEAAYEYVVVNGGAKVTGYTGSDVNVVIPETLGGYPVAELERTFDSNRTLETVVLPSTLKTLGGYTFWGCESLRSVTFNSEITEIGEYAFFQCRVLADFMLPTSVKKIGTAAFSGCHALTKLPFGGHVETIGARAFEEGWGFVSLDIPDGVKIIGTSAFADGQYMKKVVIPASVTSIGANAFSGSIYGLEIYGYTGSAAETYATNNSIPFVALDAQVPSEFTYATNEMGTFITGYTGTATDVVVPAVIDGVEMDGVWHWVFQNNTMLTSVTLQDGLELIGGEAFRGCTALERVTLPESLTTISSAAFRECTALKEIVLPDNATLGWGAFYGCSNLESVTLPSNLTVIPSNAFRECSLLISAPIPAGVTKIDEYAFYECHNLRGVEIPAGVTEIGTHAYGNCEMIEEIVLPEALQTLGGYAFYSCASLTGVEFNSDIAEIGEFTFFQCGNLKDIQLPASVTSIGASAFTGCNALTTLPFGEGVVIIGERAFADCYYLAEIEIPETVTSIGRQAFAFCYDLTKATVPATVTEIGEMAFWNNDESFTIYGYTGSAAQTYAANNDIAFVALDGGESTPDEPDDPEIEETPATSFNYTINDGEATILQFIGSETQVVIPAKIEDCPVTRVNSGAFYGQAVTSVVFPESVWEIGEYCFSLCDNLESVTITAATETIGANILNECPKASIIGVENSYAHLYAQRWNIPFTENGSLPARTSDYYLTTDGTEATVLFYSGSMTDLVIPDVIDGYTITGIGNYAFTDVNGLTKVTLPSTLKVIGKHAFSYTGLQEIEIPDGVFNIGPNAFRECYSLTKATIPASVTNITSSAFRDCGDGFTIYGYTSSAAETYATEQNYLFVALDGGENPDDPEIEETPATSFEYTIADGEVTIEAFTGSETDIVVPKTIEGYPVTTIGNSAFYDCDAKSIVVQSSVTTLAGFSFTWCSQLETITIPASVVNIGDNLFLQSNSDLIIIGEAGSAAEAAAQKNAVDFKDAATGDITYNDDYGYVIADGQATVTAYSGTETVLVVPSVLGACPVTAIGSSALMNDSDVTSITIPEGVTSIGVCAMQYNYRLTEVVLPDSLTRIGAYAFRECETLAQITIPAGVTRIGENAFEAVAEGFTIYGYAGSTAETYAAENGIPFVALDGENPDEPQDPEGEQTEGSYTYTVTDGKATIVGYAGSEMEVTIPAALGGYPVVTIGEYAFEAKAMTVVIIPDSVTTIEKAAFYWCQSLQAAAIPESVVSIGTNAFSNAHTDLLFTGVCDSAAQTYAWENAIGFADAQTGTVLFDNDFAYTLENGVATLTLYTGDDSELVVPAEYDGYPVGALRWGVLQQSDTLTKVTFEAQVPSIPRAAFQNCDLLEEVVLPDSVSTIEPSAFKWCYVLRDVYIPASVTSIDATAFDECPSTLTIHGAAGSYAQTYAAENGILFEVVEAEEPEYTYSISYDFMAVITGYTGEDNKLVLPSELGGYPVGYIGDYAFENRTTLLEVTLPATLKRIGTGAFSGCTSLWDVVIPQGVTEICDSAFYGCTGMTGTELPDSVTSIGGFAYYGCSHLKKAIIPESVTSIGARAFHECAETFAIHGYAGSEAQTYAQANGHKFVELDREIDTTGFVYDIEYSEAKITDYNGSETGTLYIPSELEGYPVTSVGRGAFYGCQAERIVVPECMSKLWSYSFAGCENLTDINIPASVTAIGECAFLGCSSELIVTGTSGSAIEAYAKKYGVGFKDAATGEVLFDNDYGYEIVNGEATIYAYTGLESELTLPNTLEGCPVTALGDCALKNNERLTSVVIPAGVKMIGAEVLQYCYNLTHVEIPEGVERIGAYAFVGMDSLMAVTVPASVTEISLGAFTEAAESFTMYGYTGSAAQTYASENGIPFVALDGGETDETLTEGKYIYTVEEGKATVVAYAGGDVEAVIPQTLGGYPVTAIGAHAFEGDTVLMDVTIPEGVKSIGEYAFSGCTALMQPDLPVSLETIGAHAFDGCSVLNFVEFEKNVTFVGEDAFANCGQSLFFRAYPGTAPADYADAHDIFYEYNYDECYEGDYVYNVLYGEEAAIVAYTGSNAALTIPATLGGYPVTTIAPEAFQSRTDITSVVFPEGLTLIATNAFAYCENLSSVSFPSTLIEFYGSAFAGTALTEITLPQNMDNIGFYAFEGCKQLTKVTVLSRDVTFERLVFSNGNENLTIYGYTGSTAEAHAAAQGIAFAALDGGSEEPEITPTPAPEVTPTPTPGEATPDEPGEATPSEPEEPSGEMTQDGYTYTVENGKATITDYEGTNSQVTLPSELGGYPVERIGQGAFSDRTEMMTVEIPEGVTEIGASAFSGCSTLSTLRLPESLLEIGDSAFEGLPLFKITLPENMTRIGAHAFESCAQLVEVRVLSRTVEIDDMAFASCGGDLTVYGYEGSTAQTHASEMGLNFVMMDGEIVSGEELVEGDFTYLTAYGKATLKSYIGTASSYGTVNIPAEAGGYPVTAIASEAFRGAPMGTVVIPESVTFIGELAFSYCPSLTKIYIPASVTTIEKRVGFRSSSGLMFYGAADSCAQTYAQENAIGFVDRATNTTLFNSDYATYLWGSAWEITAYSGSSNILTVPASFMDNWTSHPVAIISDGVFEDCDALQEVTIPESVGEIGARAFADCDNLKRVTVNCNTPKLGEDVFAGCPQDMEIHGYSDTELHAYALENGFTFVALDAQQYEYTVTDGEATITRVYVDEADVVFPTEMDGYPVTAIGANVFDYPLNVHSVVMHEGVTEIANNAFDNCSLMTSVQIPSTVRTIGAYAFRYCDHLTSIEVPKEIESIGTGAFSQCSRLTRFEIPEGMTFVGALWFAGCKSLTEIVIPDSVEAIGSKAFSECESLTGVELPQGTKTIGSGAFEYCYGLTSIEIPEAVEEIHSRAFYACENLQDVVLPENVAEIGSEAFRACRAFTQVVIPASVKTIGSEAYYGCQNVKSFFIPETVESIGADALGACPMEMVIIGEAGSYAESYALAYAHAFMVNGTDEILFDYDFGARIEDGNAVINRWEARTLDPETGTLVFPAEMNGYPVTRIEPMVGGKTYTRIILPDSLQSIADGTFHNCASLTDVTFGSGALTLGESAFENCPVLKNVTWGGVVSVGNYAFRNCVMLTTLELSPNAVTIGDGAFDSCESLYDVSLPEGLVSIGQSAFADCTSLEYVTMPDTVTSVGMYAFANCTWLRDVELSDNLTEVSAHMFQGDEQLLLVNIPSKATSIGSYAFAGCSQLYRMTLPEGLTAIHGYAFADCGMLTVLPLPESLEDVGSYAFTNCLSLTSMAMTPGWDYITEGTFMGCRNLESITFNDNVWSINKNAFNGAGLTYAVLPKNTRKLGELAFAACPNLKEVVLPPALTSVDSRAFVLCPALERVEMAEGMSIVGEYMFYNCTSLKDIQFATTVKEIGRYAFSGCTALEEVTMVEGLEKICARAFQNCDALRLLHMPDSLTELQGEAFADCDLLGIVTIPAGIKTMHSSFIRCPSLREVHISENVTSFDVTTNTYGVTKHAFTDCPNVKIYTEYGTEAVEFAIEQGIPYFYLTPVGFALPEGELFWSDSFAHRGIIRCSDPITKVVVSLYDRRDTEFPVREAVHTATGQTDYQYASLLRTQMPFETLEIGPYTFQIMAYVDTDRGEQWETMGVSQFDIVELPFRYGSPDGFEPPQLLYITGTEYVPTGTIECNYVMDSVQVRIHKHMQQYPMEGVTLTPGAKSVSAAELHAGIDLSTFETGRYDYGIYAICEGEERAMYEETFIIANYDGEMSEEDAKAIVQFCNKNDAHATFSGFKDYRDILDEISDLDMYLMGISNRNEIAMAEIIDAATSAEKSYVVGLYKAQILDLLDRMDNSTQLIDPSMDISLVKQMKGILGERKELSLDELVEAQDQLKEIYRYELRLKYGDRFSGSVLRKYIDEQCAHSDAYLDHMVSQMKRVKAGKVITSYTSECIMIFMNSAGEYQNMMAILDSLMDAYDGSVPAEFKAALELVRAEYQERALIILTETADMLTKKLAGMMIDTVTDGMLELVGGSAALTYKVAEFVLEVGLLVSGEKEEADNNFKFLTKMNLAIESNEAFKRMVDQVQGGDASAETLRKTKVAFDATQMAFDGLYELMIKGYSDHANVEEWRSAKSRLNRLSIL